MNLLTRLGVFALAIFAVLSAGNVATLVATERRAPSTTAHSIVNPSYKRERLPDGRWKSETYAFGKGSLIDRSGRDDSLSALSFEEICRILAVALAQENYVPTPDVESTDLVIVVSWGKTVPYDDGVKGLSLDGMSTAMSSLGRIRGDVALRSEMDGNAASPTAAESSQMSSLESEMDSMLMMQAMSDRARRQADDYNARLLGYAPALADAYSTLPIGPQRTLLDDLVAEIETPRYFVILQAYDFRKMWKEKKRELLWMTRFSIRAKGRRFDEELADMASAASTLFGADSGKLKRRLHPGRGEMGELEVVGIEEEPDGE